MATKDPHKADSDEIQAGSSEKYESRERKRRMEEDRTASAQSVARTLIQESSDDEVIDVVGGVEDENFLKLPPGPSSWMDENRRRGRINWNRIDVQELLLGVLKEKLDRQEVVDRLDELTGVRVTSATVLRQAHKLKVTEEAEDDDDEDTENNEDDDKADDPEGSDGKWVPRFEWSFTQRGTRGLMVFETENSVRLYRLGGKTAAAETTYYRCSQCDRLRFRSNPIKFEQGQLANSLTPPHHPKCRALTMREALNQQLDRQARRLIKTGVPPKKAHDLIKSTSGGDGLMPEFKRVSKAYYRVRRWAREHQKKFGFGVSKDDNELEKDGDVEVV